MHSQQQKRALGRGLGALIADTRTPTHHTADVSRGTQVLKVPLDQIRADTHQPRRFFDEAAILELAQSIATQGILQPILVRRQGSREYRIIAGERRFRAAQHAGLTEVPVLIRDSTDHEAFELALVENLQRSDLTPIEEAEGYRRLMETRKWTQEQVADRVAKDRSTVANALRLLNLPNDVKELVNNGTLNMGHARALLGLTKPSEISALAARVASEGLSVREIERLVRDTKPSSSEKSKSTTKQSPEAKKLIEDLQRKLGTKVALKERGAGKGTLEIEFFSYADLERIVSLIKVKG